MSWAACTVSPMNGAARFGDLMGCGDDDRARVSAAWELSLATLRAQGNQQAAPLLRVLCCFASSVPVPALLLDNELLAALCGSPAAVEHALSGLLSVGLIGRPRAAVNRPPDVTVHPLVAETVRCRAGAGLRASLVQAVGLIFAAVGQLDHDDPSTLAQWATLLAHLQALQQAEIQLPSYAEASLAAAARWISLALMWGGRHAPALAVAEAGLGRKHGLPDDHPEVLGLRERWAAARQFMGHYTEAEAVYRQVLEARLRVLGPDHRDTLTSQHNIADVLAAQGKAAEAEALFRQVLDAKLRVLGLDHPSTLSSQQEIARMLAAQGKTAEAEAGYRQVLDTRLLVQRPGHPDILTARHEIARMLAAQGKTAEAEALFRQVLEARLRLQGPGHPHTLNTRDELARMLAAQGKTAEAEAGYRQVLEARLRLQGPGHPDTLTTRHNIAAALAAQGKTAEAEAEFRQVLEARLLVQGPGHPHTLTTRRWLKSLQGGQHD